VAFVLGCALNTGAIKEFSIMAILLAFYLHLVHEKRKC